MRLNIILRCYKVKSGNFGVNSLNNIIISKVLNIINVIIIVKYIMFL